MLDGQTKIESRLAELEKKLEDVKGVLASPYSNQQPQSNTTVGVSSSDPNSQILGLNNTKSSEQDLKLFPVGEELKGAVINPGQINNSRKTAYMNTHTISFPVGKGLRHESVVLPAGSYVKAKILTGVDVPEGKTYPVLMVLDFSYIAPNDHKVDLTGCFMIAKAEGDLSTERVQMQATKMSCVSRKGKMFEREVNGFIADDKDGSFAMKGEVNSKQGRVASMAFLAGVVDGVGKAVQATQTTQSTNAFGGGTSVLTGDAGKYAMAGGASNAAGMVAQWYLQQAQNLAPSVSVGSGRDVWIVMKDKVNLPEEFFKKERKANDEGIYSYFTRVLE